LNRRLYRMGRYYEVKIDIDPTQAQDIQVYALRDDWAVQKAYQMAYQQYLKNTADERAMMGQNQLARWNDFRVSAGVGLADASHPVLFDPAGAATILTNGQFDLANVVDASGTTRTFTWSNTPSATEYSMLNEYDRMADAQDSPDNLAAPGPYEDIDADTDAATYEHLEQDGNQPPYDRNTVNQSTPWVKIAELGTGASGVQRLSTGYFTAPCGLIVVRNVGAAANDLKMSFTAKSGDYKGVHAPSMLE